MTAGDAACRFDLQLELDLPVVLDLTPELVEALSRIVREAITNAGHHACASYGFASRSPPVNGTWLEIVDDGDGFDPTVDGGFGLTSMNERAEAVGGVFTISTRPGAGTSIRVEVP